ncbi:TolC family protein [Marinifilum caeruleilacunae]|uniref:TolC family protein n=1 Tax=Marinifilum caeruleilacunae TaxID=2499076 RepID=A0ABX1X131_9BACT|nr:TolC family protein [Marinifilum caeruleilacunae]NOU62019.1 TolC family protein [Marinifilum caeruleilacunae]
MKLKLIISTYLFMLLWHNSLAQQNKMSLEQVLDLAQTKSLDAFLQKNMFQARQWEYKSYLADRLPNLSLGMTPFDYNRSFVSRYNSVNNQDEFKEQQSLYSYARMSLSQNLSFTGGTIYVDSDFGRLQNYGDTDSRSYTTTPVRIGLIQPLFAYNEQKWMSKLAPLKFAKAKKEYISNTQVINLKAIELFFNQVLASLNEQIASTNKKNSSLLYDIGKKRFEIAAIKESELLNLELNVLQANIELVKSEKLLQQACFDLNLFLDIDKEFVHKLILPENISNLSIDAGLAMDLALKNNPLLLEEKQNQIQAEMEVEKTKKESRFQATLNASYGLNQQAESLKSAYEKPLDQQKVKFSVEIPLLDWGKRRGKYKMALSDSEVIRLQAKQREMDFAQEVSQKVIDFNLQKSLVDNSKRAAIVAQKSYDVNLQLFKDGKLTVLELDDALRKQSAAQKDYLNHLKDYWLYYYSIQQYTLYDFRAKTELEKLFETRLREM